MEIVQLERYLKTIGVGTRLQILKDIRHGPLCICDLTASLNMSQPAVSQHMRRLKEELIVLDDKRGKWTFWSLNTEHPHHFILLQLLDLLPDREIAKQCCTNEWEDR